MRGQSRLREAHVELDPATLEAYPPFQDGVAPQLLFQLAAVATPADAARFASAFGLLYAGPEASNYREPYSLWQRTASELHDALNLYQQLQRARKGDPTAALRALKPLLAARRSTLPPQTRTYLDDYEPLAQASLIVAAIVSDGLAGASEGLAAAVSIEQELDGHTIRGQPGHFYLAPQITDLAALAHHTLALTIAHQVDVKRCPECHTTYLPTHGNQAYCTPACRNRAGIRRHRKRNQ